MIPTLAMYDTVFGPASTLLAIGIGVFWIWAIVRRYPLNQPLLRIFGVVLLAFSLSMALGFNQPNDPRFGTDGGFGGWLGRKVATGILAFDIPLLTGFVITLLVIAVLASLILATEWMLIPLHFRRQQAQFAAAGMDGSIFGLGNLPTAVSRSGASGVGSAASTVVEDDSTVDPLGGGSGAATATLDREEVMPSAYRAPATGAALGGGDAEVMPLNEGATLAPEEMDPANMPWYMRRRARREAERAESETAAGNDSAPEYSAEFEAPPRARRRREYDSAENEAPTQDLTANLAESVGANYPAESPSIPEVGEVAPPQAPEAETAAALDAIFAEPAPEQVTQAAAPPSVEPVGAVAADLEVAPPPATEIESRGDSFADLFGAAESALETPAVAPEVERSEDVGSALPPEPAVEVGQQVEPERTIEPVAEAMPDVAVAEAAPTEPEVEQPAPPRAAPIDDPEQLLFLQAGDAVVTGQRASISFLQRTLSIGYFQAAKLLDRLEREGVIGPYTGAVSRNVVMNPAEWAKKKG